MRLKCLSFGAIAIVIFGFADSAYATETSPTDPAPALPSETAPADKPADPESQRPLRPWRFTGMIGAVSLPRLLSLEALARFRKKNDPRWDLFSVGAGIEYLPPGLASFDTTKLSWLQTGVDGRFFFFRWAYVGARLGWQFVRADSEKYGSEVDYIASSLFIAPKAGVLHTFASGFTIGGELGAGIPFAASTSLKSEGQTDSNARKVVNTFGMWTMPFVSVRLGWTI